MPIGATLTGRLLRLEHHIRQPRSFLILANFDTVEANGFVSSIQAQPTHCNDLNHQAYCSIAMVSDQKEKRALLFRTNSSKIIIPAGYKSRWMTGAIGSN